jgi:hypothetical protein
MSEIQVKNNVSETNNLSCEYKSNNCLINKKRKLSKTKILKKCAIILCDDLINFIFTFIGFKGVKEFKMHMLKEKVYEKFKEYRFHLYTQYINKAREICTIINKLTNYGITLVAKAMDNYKNLFKNIKNEWKIEYIKNKIILLFQNLCKKNILRSDYEFKMEAWGASSFKKTWAYFLTFEYPSLNQARKNYLQLFDDILNIGKQYSN